MRSVWQNLLFIALYIPLAVVSFSFAIPPGNATPIYPAAGLAFAAYLLKGRKILPGIVLSGGLANFWFLPYNEHFWDVVCSSILIGCGEGLAVWIAASLLKQFISIAASFDSQKNIAIFFAVSACWFVSPSVGVMAMWLFQLVPTADLSYTWLTWWLGDAIGIMMLTPLILMWFEPPQDAKRDPDYRWFMIELLAVSLLVSLVALSPWPLLYLTLPIMLLFAFRHNLFGVSVLNLVVAVLFSAAAANGYGVYADYEQNQRILFVQGFVGVMCFTALIATATMNQLSSLRKQLFEVKQLSLTDPLTGIPNRFALWQRLPYMIKQALQQQQQLAVILLDIERMSVLNHTLGSMAGERALIVFTQTVNGLLQDNALFARLENDKFVLALYCEDSRTVETYMDALQRDLRQQSIEGFSLSCTYACVYVIGECSVTEVLEQAESKLRKVKRLREGANTATNVSEDVSAS